MGTRPQPYDCAVVGGGLAGLCLAIQLADAGRRVIVFEKNQYPFHKVCGEYISMESYGFLLSLGLPLDEMQLPMIRQLGISSQQGFMLNAPLAMGGFGISRYMLDDALYHLAITKGVKVMLHCKVSSVSGKTGQMQVRTSDGLYEAKIVCGSYGRYTPGFVQQFGDYKNQAKEKGPNYIGVKYHIRTQALQPDRIELHNFKNGYCGISKVEKDLYCLCYLSAAVNLQRYGEIKSMEEHVLYKNPFLKTYFTEAEFITPAPVVTSNIFFNKKQTYAGGMFLLGDAAGSITPLCGNGMSMGMRASKLLAQELGSYLDGKVPAATVIVNYNNSWNKNFSRRIKAGYYLQHLFGKNATTHRALKLLDRFPRLTAGIIGMTHGEPF